MKIIKIDQENPSENILKQAADKLRTDGVIIHPTETVYGLACLYSSEEAIKKCLAIKGRSKSQPFSLMVNSVEKMLEISGVNSFWLESVLKKLFPAPITVLIRREKKISPNFWNQFPYLGFRFPDHQLSLKLMSFVNSPIITTSANFTGQPPPSDVEEISEKVKEAVDIILDGGKTNLKIASTIIQINLNKKEFKILRKGAVSENFITKCFVKS